MKNTLSTAGKIWHNLSNLGINAEMPHYLRRRLILSNQVCLTAGIAMPPFCLVYKNNLPQLITYLIGFLLCTSYLLFISRGRINMARASIMICLPIMVVAVGYFASPEIKETQKLAVCCLLIVPLVLYGITELRSMALGIVWVMFCYVFYDLLPILTAPNFNASSITDLMLYDYASAVFLIFLISAAFAYLQRLNYQSESSLQQLLTESNDQKNEIAQQKSELEAAYQKLEILNLRSKMNPHFLYNSLNSIQNFITKSDKKSALLYLTGFSRVMRSYLNYNDEGLIPIYREIELLEEYLALEQLRFSKRFEYSIDISEEILKDDVMLPFLLIQPFVENALLHGVLNKGGNGVVKVKFSYHSNFLRCRITDNGIGRKKAMEINQQKGRKQESKGIMLSQKRLLLIYEYPIDIKPISISDLKNGEEPLGTEVEILIPVVR